MWWDARVKEGKIRMTTEEGENRTTCQSDERKREIKKSAKLKRVPDLLSLKYKKKEKNGPND